MIFSVHFYYRKINSDKAARKFESIVFAKDNDHAEQLIKNLISKYPIELDGRMSIAGSSREKSLQEIYSERPELVGKSPEIGYIYNEFEYRDRFRKYVGK